MITHVIIKIKPLQLVGEFASLADAQIHFENNYSHNGGFWNHKITTINNFLRLKKGVTRERKNIFD